MHLFVLIVLLQSLNLGNFDLIFLFGLDLVRHHLLVLMVWQHGNAHLWMQLHLYLSRGVVVDFKRCIGLERDTFVAITLLFVQLADIQL